MTDKGVDLKSEAVLCGLAYCTSLLVVVGHYFWSSSGDCAIHFQRAGAAVVIVALSLLVHSQWKQNRNIGFLEKNIGGDHNSAKILEYYVAAPILAVFGTVIWGYGDILANLVGIESVCK